MSIFLTLMLINFIGVLLISGTQIPDAENTFVFMCMDIGDVRSVNVTISLLNESATGLSITKMILKSANHPDTNIEIQGFHSIPLSYPDDCVQGSYYSDKAVKIISLTQPPERYSAIAHFQSTEPAGMGESFSLLSMDQHGTEYYVITYCEIYGKCQVGVAAYKDNTEVTITLPTHDSNLKIIYNNKAYTTGQQIIKEMNRLEAIHLQCDCDLSGTHIKSTENVAVFSGSREAVVGVKGKKSFHVEQLPPVKAWKQEYAYVCSYCGSQGAFLRVIAAEINTEIHISGYNSVVINISGGWIHRRIEKNNAVHIKANKPILVVAFVMNRFSTLGMFASSMHLVPAVESYTHSYNVLIPTFANKIEFTLIGFIGNANFSIDPKVTGTIVTRYFSNSDLHAVSFDSTNNQRIYTISYDYNFGIYALITTSDKASHAFQPLSKISPKSTPVPPKFDGDGIDSDGKKGADDKDCSNEKDPRRRSDQDCKKYHSKEPDTKGYDFQVAFPSFDGEEKALSMGIVGDDIEYKYNDNCLQGDLEKNVKPSEQGNSHGIKVDSCFTLNDTSYFQNKTITLTTTVETTVLVSVIGRTSRAAYIALPTDVLGREYFTVTYCADGSYCGCVVSSPYPQTRVAIKLSDNKGPVKVNWKNVVYKGNDVIYVTLQSHKDAFMFTSATDLTGTYIKANAPVSVVCGGNTKSAMYLEQMSPVEMARKQYTTPGYTLTYRVIATESNTIVKTLGAVFNRHIFRKAGNSKDLSYGEITSISSSRPIFVVGLYEKDNQGDMFHIIPDDERENSYICKFPDKTENKSLTIIGLAKQTINLTTNYGTGNFETKTLETKVETYNLEQSSVFIEVYGENSFAAYISGESNMQAGRFITPLGRKMNIKPEVCTPTPAIVGDKKDNDCDGLTDEEVCVKDMYRYDKDNYLANNKYIADYDIDGMLDEDCFTEISVPSSTVESTTFETTTDSMSEWSSTTEYIQFPSSTYSDTEMSSYSTTTDKTTLPSSYSTTTDKTIPSSSYSTTTDKTISPSSYSTTTDKTTLPLTLTSDLITTAPPSRTIPDTVAATTGNWETINPTASPTVPTRRCKCPCSRVPNPKLQNITVQQLKAIMEETKKELTLNKTELTSFKLKKISAKDNRPSAVTFGAFGSILIVAVIGIIVAVDLMSFRAYVEAAKDFGSAFSK